MTNQMTTSATATESLPEKPSPCPFCCSHRIITIRDEENWYVRCRSCHCEGPLEPSESEAIAAWNRRAESPRVSKLEAALREMLAEVLHGDNDGIHDSDGCVLCAKMKRARALLGEVQHAS